MTEKDMELRIFKLETQLEQLERTVMSLVAGREPAVVRQIDDYDRVLDALKNLTPKRHATLLMLMAGASDEEIAARFGVQLVGVKGTKNGIRKILGDELGEKIKKTDIAVKKFKAVINTLEEDEYERISGLTIDWHQAWTEQDKEDNPTLY